MGCMNDAVTACSGVLVLYDRVLVPCSSYTVFYNVEYSVSIQRAAI